MISNSSWKQHSVHTCCKLHASLPAPLKSIHCYSSPLSMSVCLCERCATCFGWPSEMPCGGPVQWKHELWIIMEPQHKNTPVTALFVVLPILHPLFFTSLYLSFPLFFCPFVNVVGLVVSSSETLMCSDICDSKRGEEQNHCCCPVIMVSNCGSLSD